MNLGIIGLGKMGEGVAWRLTQSGHRVIGVDIDKKALDAAAEQGIETAATHEEMLARLKSPRIVWLMLPAGEPTQQMLSNLTQMLSPGDMVIDGGNSDFRNTRLVSARFSERQIHFADVGVSGGQWGRENGYGLMVGASESNYKKLVPILDALSAAGQYAHVGTTGSGHLVKAIHNAVQYALMESYAEGYALLSEFEEVDSLEAMKAWQGGSSIRSWLLEQFISAISADSTFAGIPTDVPDSGMGRWTAEEAI